MRVAAELDVQAGRRRIFQISRHDLRRAPVEREWGDHHAPMANRHEIWLTGEVLILQQRDRVGAISRRFPSSMARRTNLLTCRLTPRPSLIDAQVRDLAHGLLPGSRCV